jgi:asparagine synthetase B (glutamine-hydrolysing)
MKETAPGNSFNRVLEPTTRKMCGIHASINTSPDQILSSELERCLCNRGPDHIGTVKTQLNNSQGELFLTFTSTVLSLRGDHVARQPFVDPVTESILCWNGEAWALRGEPVQGNDGEAILALLAEASKGSGDVMDVLRAIEGPFAFIYLDKPAKRLYYGRDRLGRRSLLVKDGLPFALSSIAETPVDGWTEVEADGCYTLDLTVDVSAGLLPERHDWTADTSLVSCA